MLLASRIWILWGVRCSVMNGVFCAKAWHHRNEGHRLINYSLPIFPCIVDGVFLILINDCFLATKLAAATLFVLIKINAMDGCTESFQGGIDGTSCPEFNLKPIAGCLFANWVDGNRIVWIFV